MSFQGELQTVPLSDLFQWLELVRKTGTLILGQGAVEHQFYFHEGAIVTATSTAYHALDSEENVRRILAETLGWTEGRFEFVEAPLPADVAALDLRLHTQQLVLDTLREFDEAEAGRAASAATAGRPAASASALSYGVRLAIVDRLLRGEFNVPLLPAVVNKVLEITRRADYAVRDLSDVILTDPVIAAQVLKHANSAFYSGERQINSILMAIQRLGSQSVANIVLVLALQSVGAGRDLFLAKRQWLRQRSLISALLASDLATAARLDRDLAFLCGLMMDFGQIVLLSLVKEVMEKERGCQAAPAELVDSILAAYHPKVGGVVGEKWQLPAPAIEAITCHHHLRAADEHLSYAAVANLTDALVEGMAPAPQTKAQPPDAAPDAAALAHRPAAGLLGLSATQIQSLLERGPEYVKFAQELLIK
jgi:HD-like signal output (HDOD) protein